VTGQVEHCPVAVTPKPVLQVPHCDSPTQVTQFAMEHSEHWSEGSMKNPAVLLQLIQVKEAPLYGREALFR
jgi:hypothetical protein